MSIPIYRIEINVLAHNEADFIAECLNAVDAALQLVAKEKAVVNVICNGCKDNTYSIAQSHSQSKKNWNVFNLDLADKANAWNFAIEQQKNENVLSIFIDGDCCITPKTIKGFLDFYQENGQCFIIAGIPVTKGRTTKEITAKTLEGEALSGGLYALTPNFLEIINKKRFRLPVGLIGDDSLLAWTTTHNFKLSNGFTSGYLLGCENAQFHYHSLAPKNIKNIKLYFRRLMRYSLRQMQQSAVKAHLICYDNFDSLPKKIDDLYHHININQIRFNTIYAPFDLVNFLLIKKFYIKPMQKKCLLKNE